MLLVVVIGVLGCLAGDLVWFEARRHRGRQIIRVLCVFSSDSTIREERTTLCEMGPALSDRREVHPWFG